MIKNERCRISIGTITYTMKAQRALASAAIYSEVAKLDSNSNGKGCTYGLEFPCSQADNVRLVLNNARIKYKNFTNIN